MDEFLHNPLVWKVVSAAVMPVCFWLGLRRLRVVRAIADTPTSRIRSAAQGYVEVSGTAYTFDDKPMVSPLTRIPSVWWQYRIEESDHSDKDRRWRTVHKGRSDDNFIVRDATGQCVVDPEDAEVFPADKQVWYGSQEWPAPQLGTSNHLAGIWHRYRYTEHRIPVNCVVDVIGEFRTLNHGASEQVDEQVADLLRRWKNDQPELLRRFDANRDGVINASEWEQARRVARDHVLGTLTSAFAQPSVHLISKPGDNRPFLIAGVGVNTLARNARWQVAAAWTGFVAAAGVFAWLMSVY